MFINVEVFESEPRALVLRKVSDLSVKLRGDIERSEDLRRDTNLIEKLGCNGGLLATSELFGSM